MYLFKFCKQSLQNFFLAKQDFSSIATNTSCFRCFALKYSRYFLAKGSVEPHPKWGNAKQPRKTKQACFLSQSLFCEITLCCKATFSYFEDNWTGALGNEVILQVISLPKSVLGFDRTLTYFYQVLVATLLKPYFAK